MVYLELRKIGNKEYYYIVKNTRRGKDKWVKETKYFGTKKPSKEELAKFLKRTENVPTKYLSKEQAAFLRKLKFNYKDYLSKLTENDFRHFEDATITSFTYNTNAIEGSTLSLQETGIIINKNITPEGKDLREIYGATNMREAFNHIKKMQDITESSIKKIHFIVMNRILEQELGEYRTVPVRIIGSRLMPPLPIDIEKEMKALIEWYSKNKNIHPFELACLFHIKFEKIHPFRDGNGRVGRLLMNFILLKHKYPLLDIKVEKKLNYYKTLEDAQVQKKYKKFIDYAVSTYLEDAKSMGWI
ncbi:MAG: Fic family protein [Nanoarchaeota archaeon]